MAFKSIEELPQNLQSLVRRMLVDGATFEDVAESVGGPGNIVPLQRSIENYFRSTPAVQKERITRQLKTAKVLRGALTNPESGHAELAEAVLITGLMGLSRRGASAGVQHAIRIKEQEANQKLREKTAKLRIEKFDLDRKVLAARLRAEETKQELIRTKLSHLAQSLEKSGESRKLGPEVIRQIHEIYGIVSVPGTNDEA
ncbi:MAG: hypothetical protein KGM47_04590 [Acidobacteriota bacterium]|nr:hypothetical protein [Acidobacteriota bacterium]